MLLLMTAFNGAHRFTAGHIVSANAVFGTKKKTMKIKPPIGYSCIFGKITGFETGAACV